MTFARAGHDTPLVEGQLLDASQSPIELSHAAFVGLAIALENNTVATPTVQADAKRDGDFSANVGMTKAGTFCYPSDNVATNILYHAQFIRITWAGGSISIHQKS